MRDHVSAGAWSNAMLTIIRGAIPRKVRIIRHPRNFGYWQRPYAARRIATFPLEVVDGNVIKKPAIKHFDKIGLRQSGNFALDPKYANAPGFAFMCGQRSKITIGDMDTADENLVADFLAKHGQTPIIARTSSGHFHAYYRHNGESRKIRLYGDHVPFDLLGGGMAIAPPSQFAKGNYQFIQGRLDDLDRLPTIKGIDAILNAPGFIPDGVYDNDNADVHEQEIPAWVIEGRRNTEIFRHCMRRAHYLDGLQALIVEADAFYRNHCERHPVMEDSELLKIAKSAWNYTESGLNRFGQHGFWASTLDYSEMVLKDGDAYLLLTYLKMHNHPSSWFMIANGLATSFNWSRKRLSAARQRLLALEHIEQVRTPNGHRHDGSALYKWLR
jgi:hypothetical protein